MKKERTKFPTPKVKLKRTKFPKPKRKPRTKFPVCKPKRQVDPDRNGPVLHCSPHLCKLLERVYKPPPTKHDLLIMQGNARIIPVNTHTAWDPSKRS